MTSPIAYLFPALGSGGRKADELSERAGTLFIPYGEGVTDGRLWDYLHEPGHFLFLVWAGFSLYIIQLEVLSNEFECAVFGGVCDFDGEE